MLVAEELDVPLNRVRLEQAGGDSIYGNVAMLVASLPFHPLDSEGEHKPTKIKIGEWLVGKVARELGINATGGSSSISDLWDPMRMAAATARASLLQAAAQAWKVPVQDITVSEGVMRHASGTSAHYGQMATAAAGSTPAQVTVKARQDWKLIGQPAQRTDIPAKLTGQAQFGADVRLPGLQFAAVRMCPMLGGSVASLESKSAMSLPGVSQVVALNAWGGGTAGLAQQDAVFAGDVEHVDQAMELGRFGAGENDVRQAVEHLDDDIELLGAGVQGLLGGEHLVRGGLFGLHQ
jgi:isoquinoline 1-oxidoreductase beta subunit